MSYMHVDVISVGKSEKECAYVDMMLENAMDFRNGVVRMVYNPEYVSMHACFSLKFMCSQHIWLLLFFVCFSFGSASVGVRACVSEFKLV